MPQNIACARTGWTHEGRWAAVSTLARGRSILPLLSLPELPPTAGHSGGVSFGKRPLTTPECPAYSRSK